MIVAVSLLSRDTDSVHSPSSWHLPQKMYQCILRQYAQTLVYFGNKLYTCAIFSPGMKGRNNKSVVQKNIKQTDMDQK